MMATRRCCWRGPAWYAAHEKLQNLYKPPSFTDPIFVPVDAIDSAATSETI